MVIYLEVPARVILTHIIFYGFCEHNCLAKTISQATKIEVHKLWNRLWRIPIISQTIARNRFMEIMRFLRFDYKQSRSHRLGTDKMGVISTIWHTIVGNCLRHYRPGTDITANEQLFPTKARCRFTQYSSCQISPKNLALNFGLPLMKKLSICCIAFLIRGKMIHCRWK